MKTLIPLQPIPSLQGNLPYSGQGVSSGGGKSVITGEVVKDLGNLNFLINVGGKQIQMQSQTPLSIGQQLRLAVTQFDPLELRILSEPPENKAAITRQQLQPNLAAAQLLLQSSLFAAKPINLTALFTILTGLNTTQAQLSGETLTNIANFYSLQHNFLQNKEEGGRILQQLINLLGLNHEHNARANQNATTTLKNSLFEILVTLSDNKQLGEEARKLTTIIEFFQLANIAQANQNEHLIPLPLSFLNQGFLQVHFDNKNQNENTPDENRLKFSLFLNMSRLGNLQIDFSGTSEGIYLHIHTESEEVSTFLEGYVYQFIENINLNLPLLGIRFSEDAQEPAGVLLKEISPQQSVGLVNTKA